LKENLKNNWLNRASNLGLSYHFIVIIALLSLVTTITEIFGIGMFLPIFQFIRLDGDIDALISDSTLWEYLINVFYFLNIEPSFLFLLLLSFGFFLCRQIFIYFGLVYNAAIRQRIIQVLRNKIFKRYLESDTLYHDSFPVGSLLNIITTEVNMAISALMGPLELIVLFIMFFGYVSMLLLLSWQMTVASVIVILIAGGISRIWIKRSAGVGRKIVKANTLVSDFLVARLSSPRLVRLSGTEEVEKNKFNQLTLKQRKHIVFTAILGAKTEATIEPIVISLSLIFLYFSYSVFELKIEIIGIYLVIVLRILPIVKGVLSQWQRFQRLLGSIEIVENYLKLMRDSIENDSGVKSVNQVKQSILIDNVSYRYPSNKSDSLKEINIMIKANEMVALVGPSGSGKSTLIDLLPRLRIPTKGVIKIDGVNIEKYTLKSLRKIISYVPQSPQIFGGTIKDHILYGNKAGTTKDEIQEAVFLAGAEDFIDQLPKGLDTILCEDSTILSGGQRQRVDLARALVRKAPILILDEPTSGLDAELEESFNQVLYKIRKETSTTIVIISHRLLGISDADNIIVLNQGEIEESGLHLELLNQDGWYAKAWKSQTA
jgi:ABC-type multidrug transport system fused ATPase/permease subunit